VEFGGGIGARTAIFLSNLAIHPLTRVSIIVA